MRTGVSSEPNSVEDGISLCEIMVDRSLAKRLS